MSLISFARWKFYFENRFEENLNANNYCIFQTIIRSNGTSNTVNEIQIGDGFGKQNAQQMN